jgi:hypothetical protein
VAKSLKALTPGLARLLDTTAARLYERVQALMRAGILTSKGGHGPGSGVTTTAGSVSLLLIGTLAAETLGQTENRTREIAATVPVGEGRCPLTGARSFEHALASVLTSRYRSSRVISISISRTAAKAAITYRDEENNVRVIEFMGPHSEEPALSIVATLNGSAIKKIATDLVAFLLAPDEIDDNEKPRQQRGAPARRSIKEAV